MDLERVKDVVSHMIQSHEESLDRMKERPDWLNDSDYRSGLWVGKRNGIENKIQELKYVMWWLDHPNGDRQ